MKLEMEYWQGILASLRVKLLSGNVSNLGIWWASPQGRMPEGRIYLIDRGEAVIQHHGRTFTMVPGSLYLIPAHSDLVYYCENQAICYWCHFRAELHGQTDLFSCIPCEYVVQLSDPDFTKKQLASLQNRGGQALTAPADCGRNEFEQTGVLLQLLSNFIKTNGEGAATDRRNLVRLLPVVAYIAGHLGERMRIPELAKIAGVESTYFTRLFRNCYGMPPIKYILQLRVDAAQQLLWQTDQTVGEIADTLGFSDSFHLSKSFKRLTGLTPTEFRRRRLRHIP